MLITIFYFKNFYHNSGCPILLTFHPAKTPPLFLNVSFPYPTIISHWIVDKVNLKKMYSPIKTIIIWTRNAKLFWYCLKDEKGKYYIVNTVVYISKNKYKLLTGEFLQKVMQFTRRFFVPSALKLQSFSTLALELDILNLSPKK